MTDSQKLVLKEQAIAVALITLAGFVAPWWGVLIASFFLGIWLAFKRRPVLSIAGLAALSWMSVAAIHDVMTGGRLSVRIAAVIGFRWAVLPYFLTGLLAFVVAAVGAEGGRIIRLLSQGATEEATEPEALGK